MDDKEVAELEEKAEEFERQRRLFMRMVNHHLRSPLASMLSVMRVVQSGAVTEQEALERMINNAAERGEDMMVMLDDIMALFQTSMPDDVGPDSINLEERVARVAATLSEASAARHISFSVSCTGESPVVTVGVNRMTLLLRHLLENAVRYADPGTTVNVGIEHNGADVALSVNSHGLAIEDDEMKNIFVEFWRGESARKASRRGTGLGLSIVKNIVNAWGGSVSAVSSQNDGTTITVRFTVK